MTARTRLLAVGPPAVGVDSPALSGDWPVALSDGGYPPSPLPTMLTVRHRNFEGHPPHLRIKASP